MWIKMAKMTNWNNLLSKADVNNDRCHCYTTEITQITVALMSQYWNVKTIYREEQSFHMDHIPDKWPNGSSTNNNSCLNQYQKNEKNFFHLLKICDLFKGIINKHPISSSSQAQYIPILDNLLKFYRLLFRLMHVFDFHDIV